MQNIRPNVIISVHLQSKTLTFIFVDGTKHKQKTKPMYENIH